MKPVAKRSRSISPIWIVPLVAAIICASLFYSSYKNAGITIQLFMKSAAGITAGRTKVMVRGIPVGTVEHIRPDLQQARVCASIKLDAQVEDILVDDTIFWVVRPQLSASSISGLETILSGSYINIQPGSSQNPKRQFTAAEEQPPPENSPGLHLVLTAKELGSLQVGSGIYYKNIQIGEVEQTKLLTKKDKVELHILIEPAYTSLVREGSRFCNASGVKVKGSLSNVSLKIASLAALLRGGIELFTPPPLTTTIAAKDNAKYPLYADFEEAEYGLPLTLRLSSSEGIVEGSTKVLYQGLVAGTVKKLELDTSDMRSVTAHIQLDPRAKEILRKKTRFWLVKPKLSPAGVQNPQLLISGSYITFEPGTGEFCNHFDILPTAPPQLPARPGKLFHLHSSGKVYVTSGSPVHFKNVPIGEVISVNIDAKDTKITSDVFIYQDYLHLINNNSIFWIQSGLKVKADIATGISFESSPLASMLFGGIAVASPSAGNPPAKEQIFPLYPDYESAIKNTETSQKGKLIHLVAEDARSLAVGAPVLFKNIPIGEIRTILLQPDGNIHIDALIHDKYRNLVTPETHFYRNGGVQFHAGLDGVDVQADSLLTIAAGGIACVNVAGVSSSKKDVPLRLYDNIAEVQKILRFFTISIQMPQSSGIKAGAAILYRGVPVGKVSKMRFAKDMKNIIASAQIKRTARKLFRKGTLIWAAQPQIGLGGIEHAKALLLGADLIIFPGGGTESNNFLLLKRPPLAELANSSGIGFVLETTHLGSISTGSPVYYRQVQVGEVTGYELSPSFQKVQIFISIKHRFQPLIRMNTRFWNTSGIRIKGGLFSGVTLATESLETIARGGIALATPDAKTGRISPPAEAGQYFPLHEEPDESWLDWQPDIKLLEKEDAAAYLRAKE